MIETKKLRLLYTVMLMLVCLKPEAQTHNRKQASHSNTFTIANPNKQLSPFTGMTRKHWIAAGEYLLNGAFSYVNNLDAPLEFPKQHGKSYPKDNIHNATERMEGLCRTLFIAAPLLKQNPGLTLNHIQLAPYYRHQLTLLTNRSSQTYIAPLAKNGGPSQRLVEFGGLAVSLFAAPEILWDPLPQAAKDSLAATMLSYGNGPTIGMNWRFFNIFVLSFFKSRGYQVKDSYLEELLEKTLGQYVADGWYNDSPAYDYYSMWAFQMYSTLWSQFFGKQYYPAYAARFAKNFNELKGNYPYMFARNGDMVMWGRSISYRMGAAVPFPLMGFEPDNTTNYGWMRRIASGTMLQFLKNPQFLEERVPTLGFYGAFEPAVQQYSCRGSAYWLGKIFLGLLTPANNPFWTATENEGPWKTIFKKGQVYNKFTPKANILITDYPDINASEIRAWCNFSKLGFYEGTENYNRLSYNSAFPWQADGPKGEVAMNYVFKNKDARWEALRLFTFKKYENEVYYRNAVLASNPNIKLELAEFPIPGGIVRIDRNTSTDTTELRLGHYALPQIEGTKIIKHSRIVKGNRVCMIDNGTYQLAMVTLTGLSNPQVVATHGLNPVSNESCLLNAEAKHIPGNKQSAYLTLLLWKKSGQPWKNKELSPVKKWSSDTNGDITVELESGKKKTIRYVH